MAKPTRAWRRSIESQVSYNVLGELQVLRHGERLRTGLRRQRTILGVLLLEPGRVVPTDRLIDLIWHGHPPATARNALQGGVSGIRSMLGAIAPVTWVPDGYRLDVSAGCVDLHRFRALVAEAKRLVGAERSSRLKEALGLWRGPVLEGTFTDELRVRLCQGLAEERLGAIEDRIATELALGWHTGLLGELTDLVRRYPERQILLEQLMIALYRSGQATAALTAYREARRKLVDSLGIEPNSSLRDLEVAILRQAPELTLAGLSRPVAVHLSGSAPAAEKESPSAESAPEHETGPDSLDTEPTADHQRRSDLLVAPAQLPRDVPVFAGRAEELVLLDKHCGGAGEQDAIVAIAGAPGMGKTALAIHWAHRARDRFPDGQLYVNLRGFDPNELVVDPGEAVTDLLEGLGIGADSQPARVSARLALYRSTLADRKVLIVLDNARDADQIRPLLPAGNGCCVLVTSRGDLAGLVVTSSAVPLRLKEMPTSDAIELLALRLGRSRVAAEPEVALDIVRRCGNVPLALSIVAARAVMRPEFGLGPIAEELHDADNLLVALGDGDPFSDIESVFSWSYEALTPPAQRLFRLLGCVVGRDVSVDTVAQLGEQPVATARSLLRELDKAHLVTEHRPGRFQIHDLLLKYARRLLRRIETAESAAAAQHRLYDHYSARADAAATKVFPGRPRLPGLASPASRFDDVAAATDWLDEEIPNLVAVAVHAAHTGSPDPTCRLADALLQPFAGGQHPSEAVTVAKAARQAAQGGSQSQQALAELHLGQLNYLSATYDVALEHLQRAAELAARVGWGRARSEALGLIGDIHSSRGKLTLAGDCYRRAIAATDASDRSLNEAMQGLSLAAVQLVRGELGQAIASCAEVISISRAAGSLTEEATARGNLGEAHRYLGEFAEAAEEFHRALRLNEALRRPTFLAANHDGIAALHRDLGDLDTALWHSRQALDIIGRTGRRRVEAQIRTTSANIRLHRGEIEEAATQYRSALGVGDEVADRFLQGTALLGLGQVHAARGDLAAAAAALETALRICREHEYGLLEGDILTALARVRLDDGDAGAVDLINLAVSAHRRTGRAKAEQDARSLLRRAGG
ncbi:BTAD domain-containing putative transcriptional regulator [Plantactinospora siamensis]|uniref:BTAD domain-containing putative transcriptional regulator n=1 Tax=Plantactinospora siamensis TaxID=555372 RepID=A0ABV6NQ49_9ACTN